MNNIVLCGFMGCGKSTVGKNIARKSGRKFLDMDSYIEEKAGMTVSEIFEKYGEEKFRDMEHDACVDETVAPGNGRLVPQGDMQALENAVRDVADSNWRADPKKMARFDKDTVYQGYVELYENVLSTLGKGRVIAT